MAQSGYTPILLYYSATPGAQPIAGNLTNGELALNTADGVLYYKNSGGTVASFSSSGLAWQAVQTANFTASANKIYPIDTTSTAITATLPASPTVGQSVGFVDYAGTFATNNVTVNPNGNKINGSTSNATLANAREALTYVYADSTQGWKAYSSYNAAAPTAYTASYLIVAGGGGAGQTYGGGGGGGGLLTGSITFNIGTAYSFVIGAGGTGSTNTGIVGGSGNNTTGLSLTAVGGGGGGSYNVNGTSGGSGGGGAGGNSTGAGSGTAGQGYAGGAGYFSSAGGGGGGAGQAGSAGTSGSVSVGGDGVASSITGSSIYYAGGGAGTATTQTNGQGGGSTANKGGGGSGNSNNGGSGVVIISVPTAYYSGTITGSPTVTTSGSNTVITFTSSGSYTA